MLRNEYKHTCAILTAGLMIELLDGMEENYSPLWKNVVKLRGNQFRDELIKVYRKEGDVLAGVDECAMLNISKLQEEMMLELSEISPNEYPIVIQFLKLCRKDPDAVFDALGMNIIRQ